MHKKAQIVQNSQQFLKNFPCLFQTGCLFGTLEYMKVSVKALRSFSVVLLYDVVGLRIFCLYIKFFWQSITKTQIYPCKTKIEG